MFRLRTTPTAFFRQVSNCSATATATATAIRSTTATCSKRSSAAPAAASVATTARSLVRWFSSTPPSASSSSSSPSSPPPPSADVVVIGGGSIGTSVLYHCQQRGHSAVLLEKDQLTSGTTWHSAGMLWRLRPSDIDIQLHAHTRDMCKSLEAETGIASWTENGGLFIATNKERMHEYVRLHETGKYFGIESRVLKPHEIPDIHPLIAVGDVVGGMYSPGDGTIDPNGVVHAYARAAKTRGAKVFENTPVASIETAPLYTNSSNGQTVKQVKAVVTASGHRIATSCVVNATGAWGNKIANMVGVQLPLLAMKHAYVVTEKLPGMHPGLPNVRDHDLSIYIKTQGDSAQIGGYEVNPEFWDNVDPRFAFGLFDLDFDTFGQNMNGHIKRCPSIEKAGIKSTVCGPESFTPDHKPLVGPQQGVRGFFNACGFNSMGMMLGGGIGREVATWITTGSPSLDLFNFDCARFHPHCVRDDIWVKDRTHESYAKTYSIVFPHDDSLAGRGSRRSPFHEELVARGCIHQARHGFERPGWFVPTDAESIHKLANGDTKMEEALTANAQKKPQGDQAPKKYDYYGAYAKDNGAWRLGTSGRRENPPAHAYPAHDSHLYLKALESELTFDKPHNFHIIREECCAARNGVAFFDQSYFGKFFLRGPEAAQAVQWICGADMALNQVPQGRVTYTPLCNSRGGVEADLTVARLPHTSSPLYSSSKQPAGEESYYIVAGGNTLTKDWEWISTQLEKKEWRRANGGSSSDNSTHTSQVVTLEDATNRFGVLAVQGPHSRTLLQSLITSPGHNLSDEQLPFSHMIAIQIAGVDVMCLRITFVGELGYELHVPVEHGAKVYRVVRTAGEEYERKHGVPVRDTGYRCMDSLSAEKSFRHWHADLSNRDTPMEAGIGFTVLSKLKQTGPTAPQFLGRAALEQQRTSGLTRKLVCLTLDDPAVLLHGMETIWRNGKCVGLVRSTAYGHTVGRSIAYGYCDIGAAGEKEGATITQKWLDEGVWQVGDRGQKHAAKQLAGAPFDPKSDRAKDIYKS